MNLIELKNINVSFKKEKILDNINLELKKSDFLGIIGPNGSGKTTLVRTMLGLHIPNSGMVVNKVKNSIGYVAQISSFQKNFPISVMDIILSGRLRNSFKLFYSFNDYDYKKVTDIMKKLEIYNLRDKQIDKLSGGQLQLVLLARALAVEPEILILDEPTSNVDIYSKNKIMAILQKLNEDVTIVVVSHDVNIITSKFNCIAYIDKKLEYYNYLNINKKNVERLITRIKNKHSDF